MLVDNNLWYHKVVTLANIYLEKGEKRNEDTGCDGAQVVGNVVCSRHSPGSAVCLEIVYENVDVFSEMQK